MRFFSLLIIFFNSISVIQAATVEKIGSSGPIVLMDSKDELTSDQAVCFFEKDKKVACGKVSKIKKLKALVKVKKSSLEKITAGMAVRPKNKKASTDAQAAEESKDPASKTAEKDPAQTPSQSKGNFKPYIAAAYAPITVFKSNNLDYQPPIVGKAEPLWKSENPISTGAYLLFGARYKNYHGGLAYALQNMIAPNNVDLDYDVNNDKKYVSLTLSRSFYSLFGDYMFEVMSGEITTLIGAGIGISSNNIKFSADQLEDQVDTSTQILSGKSSLMVVSARIPIMNTIALGPFSLLLGGTVSIGLVGTAKTSGTLTDANTTDGTGEFTKFKSALDHKKNTLGIELFGGLLADF
jgi:hypothetical protein